MLRCRTCTTGCRRSLRNRTGRCGSLRQKAIMARCCALRRMARYGRGQLTDVWARRGTTDRSCWKRRRSDRHLSSKVASQTPCSAGGQRDVICSTAGLGAACFDLSSPPNWARTRADCAPFLYRRLASPAPPALTPAPGAAGQASQAAVTGPPQPSAQRIRRNTSPTVRCCP